MPPRPYFAPASFICVFHGIVMRKHEIEDRARDQMPVLTALQKPSLSAFFSQSPPDVNHPSLIHFSSMPLFKLETSPERYVHLLKKKDQEQIRPIVNYFISKVGHVVYLGGDAVRSLALSGRRQYKVLNILAIMTSSDIEKYSSILNNIISSNDGAFSMGLRYWIRKNRNDGCFKDIALARYIIEPRLEGLEKLLYLLRSSSIELDLTTQHAFSLAFGHELI
jgi:hypothetical protein